MTLLIKYVLINVYNVSCKEKYILKQNTYLIDEYLKLKIKQAYLQIVLIALHLVSLYPIK